MEKNSIKVAGSTSIIPGEYSNISVAGSAKFLGGIKADKISVSGSCKFLGCVEAEALSVSGSISSEAIIKAKAMKISGSLRTEGKCEGDSLRIFGGFKLNGDLNFDLIEIDLPNKAECNFTNIYGDKVIINSRLGTQCFGKEIEATTIRVEYVHAEKISGENIFLGRGTVVDLIEYSKSLEICDGVVIKTIVKI